jgi:hypothetical protein
VPILGEQEIDLAALANVTGRVVRENLKKIPTQINNNIDSKPITDAVEAMTKALAETADWMASMMGMMAELQVKQCKFLAAAFAELQAKQAELVRPKKIVKRIVERDAEGYAKTIEEVVE